MTRKLLYVIIGISLLIIGAVSYVIFTPKQNDLASTADAPDAATDTGGSAPIESPERNGSYVEYSEEAVLATNGTKLLFFHAPWCSQCRQVEESIKADGLPSGVTVLKVDYDSNQSLRQKYGVTLQTTFVKIDDDGNKIASYVAYEEPQFSSVERELLN